MGHFFKPFTNHIILWIFGRTFKWRYFCYALYKISFSNLTSTAKHALHSRARPKRKDYTTQNAPRYNIYDCILIKIGVHLHGTCLCINYIGMCSRNAIFLLCSVLYTDFCFRIRPVFVLCNALLQQYTVILLQFSILRDYFNNVPGTIECTCYVIPLKTTAGIRIILNNNNILVKNIILHQKYNFDVSSRDGRVKWHN